MPYNSVEKRKAYEASKTKDDKYYLHETWFSVRKRCNTKTHYAYPGYGGRGIKICQEWDSFENFFQWAIKNGYKRGLTLDRIDVNGNYCPENCRWATWKEQGNNRRNNKMLTYQGITKTMSEWADIVGMTKNALWRRLNDGWSVEDALTIPLGVITKWNRKEDYNGKRINLHAERWR